MRVYLCGAIDQAADQGKGWRRELTAQLVGHEVLDPTSKPNQCLAGIAKQARDEGAWEQAGRYMREVRQSDLEMLVACDWVLAYIDPDQRPCGSYFELMYARLLSKPVFIVSPNPPLWLLAESTVHRSFEGWLNLWT